MSILNDHDRSLIDAFISRQGVRRFPIGMSTTDDPAARFKTALGKPHSPAHRYSLACSYARARGLSGPVWTDISEAELIEYRKNGLSYRKIARLMGRTKAAIQARMRYLKLGRRLSLRVLSSYKDPAP